MDRQVGQVLDLPALAVGKGLGHLIPEGEILHPYPEVRFASKHPR